MTASAPSERTSSTLRVLQTPVTLAPSAFAICTANVPTPPEAPLISTFVPAPTPPARRPCSAVIAATGTAAACSKLIVRGLWHDGSVGFRRDVLAEGAGARAEDFIARLELRDARPDRLDDARIVHAEAELRRPAQARAEAHDVGRAAHHVPVERIGGRRAHLDDDLAGFGDGLLDVLELQDVREAVVAVHDGLDRMRGRAAIRTRAGVVGAEVRHGKPGQRRTGRAMPTHFSMRFMACSPVQPTSLE